MGPHLGHHLLSEVIGLFFNTLADFVTDEPGHTGAVLTEQELIELTREKLANFKALEQVEFVDPGFFPRNALGKILKTALRTQG